MRLRSNAHFLAGALVAGIAVLTTTQVAGTDDPGVEAARAEKQLEVALGFQARLENMGVRVWGVEKLVTSYVGAMTKLVEGDAHFRNGDFDSAAATYRHAKALFEQLEASRPERLRRALADGQAALDRLDDVMAVHHFEIALAAEPRNTVAENGLQRARNLPEARKRFDRARRLEASGELEGARRAYRDLESLDGDFPRLRTARARLDRRIEDRDYRRAVAGALSALERRDYARARAALGAARRLRPRAPEARQIEARIKAAIVRDHLDELRHGAAIHERNEDWAASLEVYRKALGIDAHVGFAVTGAPRAERFLELNRQLDHYLARPDRLHSAKPRAHARELLDIVGRTGNLGPRLLRKVMRLNALIAAALDPRPVILRSDEATNVAIHRVAQFGRIREHRVRLLPGVYTAVGTRAGYRDVRIRFYVRASNKAIVVDVRCLDRI